MDNLTHTLYGLALGRAGLNRLAPRATATLIIGAIFPDIDVVTFLGGSICYLKYHRGITHSLIGIPLGSLVLGTVMYFIHNRLLKKGQSVPWWRYFLLAIAGIGSHVLLDFTNSYGLRPFLPFTGSWYAGDLVFIVDPWMLTTLGLTLGLSSFFGLINQEIGVRKRDYRTPALICLFLIVAYWGAKGLSHRQALMELAQFTDSDEPNWRVGAVPQAFNPFGWYGIVETESAYRVTEAGWRPLEGGLLGSPKNRRIHKAEQAAIVEAASGGPQARIFLDFARYPVFSVVPNPQGYRVTVRDLRFESLSQRRKGFVLTVDVGQDLRTLSENFSF